MEVAMKFEHDNGFESDVVHEYKVYRDIAGCPGISRFHWCGVEAGYNVMVIDRFQQSLDELVRQAPLGLHTAASFAGQMVSLHPLVSIDCSVSNLISYVP